MKITVCIPARNRPDLLGECIASCLRQTLQPCEILVGDDSTDSAVREMVGKIARTSPVPIRYFHNCPPLGQGGNVNRLISEASGDYISLMHDDDFYTDRALEILSACFSKPGVVVAYGKQLIIDRHGVVNRHASEVLNRRFFRTPATAGIQKDLFRAAVIQQFPNNGYLISAALAKSVSYVEAEKMMGNACDLGFSILCARACPEGRAFFADEFTAYYRHTDRSLARNNPKADSAYRAFKYVLQQDGHVVADPLIREWLRNKAPVAIAQGVKLGKTREALMWYFSRWHAGRILTPGGLRRTLLLLTGRSHFRCLVCGKPSSCCQLCEHY